MASNCFTLLSAQLCPFFHVEVETGCNSSQGSWLPQFKVSLGLTLMHMSQKKSFGFRISQPSPQHLQPLQRRSGVSGCRPCRFWRWPGSRAAPCAPWRRPWRARAAPTPWTRPMARSSPRSSWTRRNLRAGHGVAPAKACFLGASC